MRTLPNPKAMVRTFNDYEKRIRDNPDQLAAYYELSEKERASHPIRRWTIEMESILGFLSALPQGAEMARWRLEISGHVDEITVARILQASTRQAKGEASKEDEAMLAEAVKGRVPSDPFNTTLHAWLENEGHAGLIESSGIGKGGFDLSLRVSNGKKLEIVAGLWAAFPEELASGVLRIAAYPGRPEPLEEGDYPEEWPWGFYTKKGTN